MKNELLLLLCPTCLTSNRVPGSRLNERPKCGKCKSALVQPEAIVLNDSTLSLMLEKDGLPLVVDFWAAWCGPCRQMAPAFQDTAELFDSRLRFAKVDTEACPLASSQHSIRSLPTLILFVGGKEVDRRMGLMSRAQITQWLEERVASSTAPT